MKAKGGADMPDVAAGLLEEVDETGQLPGGGDAHFACGVLLIFQKNLGSDGPNQAAIHERLADEQPRIIPPEHSQNDVGVDADRHGYGRKARCVSAGLPVDPADREGRGFILAGAG